MRSVGVLGLPGLPGASGDPGGTGSSIVSGVPGLVCGPMMTVSTVLGVPSLEDVYDVSDPDSGSHRLGSLATVSGLHLSWISCVSSFFESAMGMPWLEIKADRCKNKIKIKCIVRG